MIVLYELIVQFISIYLIARSVKLSIRTNNSIYLLHLLFCFVFVLPLILDFLLGQPVYSLSRFYGFNISKSDESVRTVYATYLLTSQFIMLIGAKIRVKLGTKSDRSVEKKMKKSTGKDPIDILDIRNIKYSKYLNILLWYASFITVVLVLVLPMSKYILWTFVGWRDSGLIIDGQKYYSIVEKLSYVSIVSAIILLFNKKYNFITKSLITALIYMSISVQAKRSILLFISVVIISFLYFNMNTKKRKWIYVISFMFVVIAVYYSIYVKITYRGYGGFEALYNTLRIDFFRDDTVKMVIYSLINPNSMSLLEYPGQSLITQIGSVFPLQFLGVPVIGYNAYLTAALLGTTTVDIGVNWMTTSIFDEMLANFGFFGFWVAPLILLKLSKIADRQNKKLAPITISLAMLIMMYPTNYIMWYIQFWLSIVIFDRIMEKRKIELF